jgi:hypothetical protein
MSLVIHHLFRAEARNQLRPGGCQMNELKDPRAIEPGAAFCRQPSSAATYDSGALKLLLGDSMHPGGAALTERLGVMLNLGPQTRVLDVATGRGASAFTLATRFGCEVIGIDYSRRNVADVPPVACRADS